MGKNFVANPKRHWRPREVIRGEQNLSKIRAELDGARLVKIFQGLTFLPDVQPELVKDKIAEALIAVACQSDDFRRERVLREECSHYAKKLHEFPFLENSERRRSLRNWITVQRKILERRSSGIERHGRLELREYLLHEQSDYKMVCDLAVINLVAILRRLTGKRRRSNEVFLRTIARLFEVIGALPDDDKDHTDAISQRFKRANRWPRGCFASDTPPPVDFQEHLLFGTEHAPFDTRFPLQPSPLPPKYYSIAATPPRTLVTSDRTPTR